MSCSMPTLESPVASMPSATRSVKRSTQPTRDTSGLLAMAPAQAWPMPPAPTSTARSRLTGLGLTTRARATYSSIHPSGIFSSLYGARQRPTIPVSPVDAVGDHTPDDRVVIDGVLLVARAEVEHAAGASIKTAPGAENLAAGEARNEHQLVGLRDVEEFPVHLLGLDGEDGRDPPRDRMGGIDGPNELALANRTPPQVAARPHQ